jgi:hypothetical protein
MRRFEMGLDSKIIEAIEAATAEANQSDALARKLVAWLEAIASRNDIDNAEMDRHLEVLYEETSLEAVTDQGGES